MKSTSKSNTAQWLVHLWNLSPVVQQDDDAILLLNCHLGDKCQQNIQHYPPLFQAHYVFTVALKLPFFFCSSWGWKHLCKLQEMTKKISNCNLFPKSCGFMIIYVKTTSSDQSTSSVKIIFVLYIVILGLQHHLSALKNEQGCDKFCGPPYPSVYIALCRYWFY